MSGYCCKQKFSPDRYDPARMLIFVFKVHGFDLSQHRGTAQRHSGLNRTSSDLICFPDKAAEKR